MIFVTAGTEHGFDRLFRAVDGLAARGLLPYEAFGQTGLGAYIPEHFASTPFVAHEEFQRRLRGASILISHVGMGTTLQAAEWGVPAVLLPRRGALGEHVNDHQVDSAEMVEREGLGLIAWTEDQIAERLTQAMTWRPTRRRSDHKLVGVVRRDLLAIARTRGLPVNEPTTVDHSSCRPAIPPNS